MGGDLIHPLYLAFEFDRVAAKFASVEILTVHVNGVDLVIVVGRVVVDALRCVAAGGVNRDLILVFSDLAAAALLIDGAEDMEELAHTGALVILRKGT